MGGGPAEMSGSHKDTMRAAGTVTKKLVKWLAEKGYVKDAEALEMAEERAGEAARD